MAFFKWNQYIEIAKRLAVENKESMTVDPAVLLRIAKHIEGLNKMALENINVIGCCPEHHE